MDAKNEQATVLEILGTQQSGLRGALREMEAVGLNTTASQQVLYHAQIAPAFADEMSREQFVEAADRLGKALKLDGQPRALVLHKYQGHEHLHIVWSRADVERGQVVSNSWDRVQHHRLCRTLELEWGLQVVPSGYGSGSHSRNQQSRDTEERQNTRLREVARRDGKPFREKDIAAQEIAWCYDNSTDGKTLAAQLKEMGYVLSVGKTGYVATDEQSGATYSIARYAGVKRDEVRAKCADIENTAPSRTELTAEHKAGRHIHMSRRKAKQLLRNELGHNVANDAGNHKSNKRRALNRDKNGFEH